MRRKRCAGRVGGAFLTGGVLAIGCLLAAPGRADVATLKNGMTVEGTWGPISSMFADPTKASGAGGVQLKRIVVLDNQLTRTFFGTNQLAKEFTPSPAIRAVGGGQQAPGRNLRILPQDRQQCYRRSVLRQLCRTM